MLTEIIKTIGKNAEDEYGLAWRHDPITGEMRFHLGFGHIAPVGSPVRALAGGRVTESGVKGGYGNTVVVETDDGRTMLYAHNYHNLVRVGDRVVRGDAIALIGSPRAGGGAH